MSLSKKQLKFIPLCNIIIELCFLENDAKLNLYYIKKFY